MSGGGGELADAARCSGSHSLNSHHWDSDWTQQPCTGGAKGKIKKEINPPKRISLQFRLSPKPLVCLSQNPRGGLLRFIVWGLRSDTRGGQNRGVGLNHHPLLSFLFFFQQKIDFFSSSPESFWKSVYSADDLLRGSPSLQCMVMRDVQLTELGEKEEHNNRDAGAKLQNVWILYFVVKCMKIAKS